MFINRQICITKVLVMYFHDGISTYAGSNSTTGTWAQRQVDKTEPELLIFASCMFYVIACECGVSNHHMHMVSWHGNDFHCWITHTKDQWCGKRCVIMWARQYWSEFSTILYADDNVDSPVWVTKMTDCWSMPCRSNCMNTHIQGTSNMYKQDITFWRRVVNMFVCFWSVDTPLEQCNLRGFVCWRQW